MQPVFLLLEQSRFSASVARRRATAMVAPWSSERFVADLGLMVTELVANAVRHGGAGIHMEMCLQGSSGVRVEVFDGSVDLPELQHLPADSTSGRGLRLVDALASDWGSHPHPGGKVVWFELHDNQIMRADEATIPTLG